MRDTTSTASSDFQKRIDQSAGDLEKLNILYSEASTSKDPDISRLRIKITILLQKARKIKNATAADHGNVRISAASFWMRLMRANALESPDERPLHGYVLKDALEFDLEEELRRRSTEYDFAAAPENAALFCLCAARWFGRGYRGGIRKWQDLFTEIGIPIRDANVGRALTRDGLIVWRRPVALGAATCQWLMTLAIEGGFPVGVLDEPGRWAAAYLEALVGRLSMLDDATEVDARQWANALGDMTPQAYRQDVFQAVAAALALSVSRLRKTCLTENVAGIPHSIWLDAHDPDWKDGLPVSLTTETSRRLIEGLVDMPLEKGLFVGRVGVSRLLRLRSGQWSFGLRFFADGELRSRLLDDAASQKERLRAHPSGVFAKFADGELAVLDPPIESDALWRVYPARNRTIDGAIPLNIPVQIELRSGGRAVRQIAWPGGAAVTGDFFVFSDLSETGDGGQEAEYLGRSSGKFAPAKVVIVSPLEWTAKAKGEGSTIEGVASDALPGRRITRLEGAAILQSPLGDEYFVQSGQSRSTRDQLSLTGDAPDGFEAAESDVDVYCGRPTITLLEGDRERSPHSGEVGWRPSGRRQWEFTSIAKASGRIDVGWIEPDSGYVRDRRKVFILPPETGLFPRRSRDGVDYRVSGLPPIAFVADQPHLNLEYGPSGFRATYDRSPSRRANLCVELNDTERLPIVASFPIASGLARWDGRPVAGSGARGAAPVLSLRDLRELLAHADGRDRILVSIREGTGRVDDGRLDWSFDDECPLRTLADEIEWLFDQTDDLDAGAIITLQGPGLNWRVERFALRPTFDSGHRLDGFRGVDPKLDLEIVGRSVLHPEAEVSLARIHSTDLLTHGVPSIEHGRGGAWIVYLRSGHAIVGRPSIAWFHGGPPEPARTGIGVAAGISDEARRNEAIQRRMQAISDGRSETRDEIGQLVDVCTGLNGIPAAGFDVLRHLVSTPIAFARVASAAGEGTTQVLRLDEQMPFLSCAIPWSAWRDARSIEEDYYGRCLAASPGARFDSVLVGRIVESIANRLIGVEPLLAGPLHRAGWPGPTIPQTRDLTNAAQDFIRRHGDETSSTGIHRREPSRPMPQVFAGFDQSHLDALDAPCAAAAAAAGHAKLAREELRAIRATRRLDPIYFEEAFTRRFFELCGDPKCK